jgi:AraC-like DNA-binding protein
MSAPLLPALFDAALRGIVVALLLILAGAFVRERPRLAFARVGVLMALGLCVQVVSSAPAFEEHVPWPWQAPMVAISVANAVLFWVFAQSLFDDEFAWRPRHWVTWGVVAAFTALNCTLLVGTASLFAPLAMGVQRAVPLVFAVLAVMAAAAHWRADLVEGRRWLRAFIVATGAAYSIAMLAVRLGSPRGRLSQVSATVDVVLLLVIVGVMAWKLLRLSDSGLLAELAPRDAGAPPAPVEAPPDPAEDRLAETLQRVMTTERPYLTEDLTVAGLAARLAVPEYRLRRLINRRLGHRNFNAYVNGFRLDDARAALADPQRRETPVLTIALDAGFQSIGPFNRAFKAATGLTPTEFRRQSAGR